MPQVADLNPLIADLFGSNRYPVKLQSSPWLEISGTAIIDRSPERRNLVARLLKQEFYERLCRPAIRGFQAMAAMGLWSLGP